MALHLIKSRWNITAERVFFFFVCATNRQRRLLVSVAAQNESGQSENSSRETPRQKRVVFIICRLPREGRRRNCWDFYSSAEAIILAATDSQLHFFFFTYSQASVGEFLWNQIPWCTATSSIVARQFILTSLSHLADETGALTYRHLINCRLSIQLKTFGIFTGIELPLKEFTSRPIDRAMVTNIGWNFIKRRMQQMEPHARTTLNGSK